jgi:heptosyltransferase I
MNDKTLKKRLMTCRKILVVKPSSLGDIVHSLPFLNSIKTCFPKAEIHWVIAKGLEGLLECHPMVNRLIIINKDMWKKLSRTTATIKEVRNLLKDIRNERYDLAVDLQGLLRSGIITMATRAPVRIGFSEAREGSRLFYNVRVKGGRDVHAVERYMKIAGVLGCDEKNILFPFSLCDCEVSNVEGLKCELKEYAVIVPGARWDTKIWAAENFGRIASLLPVRSIVIGSKGDTLIAEKVVQSSGGKAVSLAGRTSLKELIELMRHAKFVISNDSGPMHIAAGFQVPVVAIFGPTSPVRTGPYGTSNIVVESYAECAPCFKKKCKDMKCMRGISVETVYERMRNIPGIK